MGRILAIDYGKQRTGLAWTDHLRLSINPLPTTDTSRLLDFIKELYQQDQIDIAVIGVAHHRDGRKTRAGHEAGNLAKKLARHFPELKIELIEEDFSSKEARELLVHLGVKKKKRRERGRVDQVSAMLILKMYMNQLER